MEGPVQSVEAQASGWTELLHAMELATLPPLQLCHQVLSMPASAQPWGCCQRPGPILLQAWWSSLHATTSRDALLPIFTLHL